MRTAGIAIVAALVLGSVAAGLLLRSAERAAVVGQPAVTPLEAPLAGMPMAGAPRVPGSKASVPGGLRPSPRAGTPQPPASESGAESDRAVLERMEVLRNLYPGGLLTPEEFAEQLRAAEEFNTQLQRAVESFLAGLPQDQLEAEWAAFFRGEGGLRAVFDGFLRETFTGVLGPADFDLLSELARLSAQGERDGLAELMAQYARATGTDPGELMLHLGLTTGLIGADEILGLVRGSGLGLPPLAIHDLALHGRVEDIDFLARQAQFSDLSERSPMTGHTAIGTFIHGVGAFGEPLEPSQAVAQLRTMLDLGIETTQADGQLDLLSHILRSAGRHNREAMLSMAAYLVQSGYTTSPQQLTVWTDASPQQRERLTELFTVLQTTPLVSPVDP